LHELLAARDLDELFAYKEMLADRDRADIDSIEAVLEAWSDPQAVANLLMNLDLIPEDKRFRYIKRGLAEPAGSYLKLATVVGLSRLGIERFAPAQQSEIVEQLIAAIAENTGPIADQASSLLASYITENVMVLPLHVQYEAKLVPLLDHPSDAVKHNVLVALIPLVGLENLRRFLDEAVTAGHLSRDARQYVEGRLGEIDGLAADNKVNMAQLDLHGLALPLLAYIPNLSDW
jgi:hypothetical protein